MDGIAQNTQPEDNLPWNMFGDPSFGMGTAWLPMMAYGDPSGQPHHRYNYDHWSPSSFDFTPVIGYAFDTVAHSPWGWCIRKTTYEDGTEEWRLTFSLSKTVFQPQCWWEPNIALVDNNPPGDPSWQDPAAWGIVCNLQVDQFGMQYVVKKPVTQLGHEITWQAIESLRIEKKTGPTTYEEVQGLNLTEPFDDYLRVVSASFDPQISWLTSPCAFACDTYVHETYATISGIEPRTGESMPSSLHSKTVPRFDHLTGLSR